MKEDIKNTYNKEELENIIENGCVSCCAHSHIYYKETVDWFDKFEEEIWALVEEFAEDQEISPLEFIATLNGSETIACTHTLKNLLCWFAVEEMAREILEGAKQ